ncbi:guanine nucleotide exchange factor subunit RIC1-like [Littorina saxatilis]|uniref:guanine nucleotide exchange factor subunit RIC1-like n=1 Tax=Littorina saxatilis TaxID=31220 RepID=UPI0038B5D616
MYFPIGWPKCLKRAKDKTSVIQHVVSSCDRMFFAVITENSVTLWYSKPCIQIVCHVASKAFVEEVGTFRQAEWKPDCSMLALMTSKRCVVFMRKELDLSVQNHHCLYVQQEGRVTPIPRHNINGILDSDSVPAYKLTVVSHLVLSAPISCFLSVRDELVVATEDGNLNRLRWNGNRNDKATLHLSDIPVSSDLQQFKASKLSDYGHTTHMEYSPTLGGYSMVLSSGRAVFVIPPSARSEKKTAHGVWAQELTSATCVAVNHRYRLIAFGAKSGEGHVYMTDEEVGALELSHKLVISSREFPDAGSVSGPIRCMRWTPDGTALAVAWQNGGLSLWSVYGALLLCTLGGDYSTSEGHYKLFPAPITCMEWGLEGYHLWAVTLVTPSSDSDSPRQVNGDADGSSERRAASNGVCRCEMLQFQFLKSALTVNPCMSNHEHVFLQGEDKLYMSTGDTIWRASSHHHTSFWGGSSSYSNGSHPFIGNKQWQIIPISHSYLASNWPIRYSAVDRAGQCVAVAGKTGFAHYALFNRKWKLFGNETQERDMVVSGGITWWKDFMVLACYNIPGQRDEVRCYPRSCKLDNTFAQVCKVPSPVLLLNTFRDSLIIFCADSHVIIFSLERKSTQPNPSVQINKVQEVSVSSFIPHPLCVAGVFLTSLTSESGSKIQHTSREAESLLLNVSGKLLMFQRDHSGPQIRQNNENHKSRVSQLPFCQPSVVATSVENLWTTTRANLGKLQLMDALWLGCGAHGMKVWLPLFPRNEGKAHNFMSRRIMLPFRVDIYPLAVLFEDAVILGAACDAVTYNISSPGNPHDYDMPFCTLERTSQIYLHHILRQLLRRNLGVNALELARSCTELTYFPHVLELLLHEVLEAEATSKEPIPDPLLPRVVAFIQEFPEYLQTIVHCARKTEVALWPYLFSTVGNPKDLFEECLIKENLTTAATYLIILQNLEKPIVSRQHATLLLDSALNGNCWDLCRDLVRFLKAIDPNDTDSPIAATTFNRFSGSSSHATFPTPPRSPEEDSSAFSYSNVSNVGRMRTSSIAGPSEGVGRETPRTKEKVKHTVSDSLINAGKRLVDWPQGNKGGSKQAKEPTAEEVYIDMILGRHARKLLASNQLRTLGSFAANLDDFHLVSWLKRERVRSAKVEDFVVALKDLHKQFQWPLPVLSPSVLQQIKQTSISRLSSTPILDEELPASAEDGKPTLDVATLNSHNDGTVLTQMGMLRQRPSDINLSTSTSDDIILKPQSNNKMEEGSVTTLDTETSSLFGDYEIVSDQEGGDQDLVHELEILSQEVASKGPQQSELELTYVLQIMLEAGCLEWALIVAVVLRDSLAVIRTVNTASMTDTPLDMVARMREGLSYLELWADTQCMGYKPFLHTIKGQISVLAKLVEETPPSLQLDVGAPSSGPPSVEEGNLSPTIQSIHSDSDSAAGDSEQGKDDKASECVLS